MRVPLVRVILAGAIALAAWSSAAADSDTLTCGPDPTCEDRCRAHSEELFRACVTAGGDPTACAERARAALAACVQENCRPDPTCEEQCKARAEEFLRRCLAAGDDSEACAERARAVLEVCLEERCRPEPTCEERCRARAVELFRACLASGGDPEACAERARAAFAACVEENCRPAPTCEDRCRAHAEEFFRRCVAAGNDSEACAERARMVLAVCIEENCVPDPTCEERCRAHAEEVFRACVAAGGDEATCSERAHAAFEACVREHCVLCLCPDVIDPVCGVDGKTYPNACLARCAGVEVAYPGECRTPCHCNDDCREGNVCRDGTCQPPCDILCITPDPVCGSDGKTYFCGPADAACHGVTVLHHGECRPVCGRDADCQAGSICQPAPTCADSCGCASFCVPCVCPDVFDPVCGADGKTYPNACEARCAHVEVVHAGGCQDGCRCNADCREGSVCRDGTCQPPCEILCITPDPVCGSDGKTYFCGPADAACHGVMVLHHGECRHACEKDADCPIGAVCQPAVTCSDPCGCAKFCAPCACPTVYDPVCGVDGKTYSSACEARCAHVEVAYKGPCQRPRSYRTMAF